VFDKVMPIPNTGTIKKSKALDLIQCEPIHNKNYISVKDMTMNNGYPTTPGSNDDLY